MGSVPSGSEITLVRPVVGKRTGGEALIYSIASLLVCLLQPAKFPVFTQLPALAYEVETQPI